MTCTYRDAIFCYRSSLRFDKRSLANVPSMTAWGFKVPRDGPKRRMVRGLLPSCHGCITEPIVGRLAPPPAKAPPGPLTQRGPSSDSPPPSCYNPPQTTRFPWATIQNLCMFLYSDPQSQPIPFMNPSKVLPITIKLQLPSNIPSLCTATAFPPSLLCTMHVS